MSGGALQGPFLTRGEAAQRSGLAADELPRRPDLLHVGGRSLEEVYFAFQFDGGGIRRDIGGVVVALRGRLDDLAIASWLTTPNTMLAGDTPLSWLRQGGATRKVMEAATAVAAPGRTAEPRRPGRPIGVDAERERPPARRRRRFAPPMRSHATRLGHQSGMR